jgi:GTP pyrophosphokinase/guanosine-3',5'-bis(diphosphate) 3'-pyrophosphohydrolase
MVQIDGTEGASVQMAPCCRPIPFDAIVGYLGRGEGLVVHTAECGIGKRLYERDSERWMRVEWAEQPSRPFETGVTVLVRNGKGVLAEVAAAVATAEADITHIDMGDEPAAQTAELRLVLRRARPAAPGRGDAHAEALGAGAEGRARQAIAARLAVAEVTAPSRLASDS